ncbi:DNA-binding protein [Halochromatium salexigens]|uniref:KfrA N-terminal DNA-binding domain-containing protein n=1 Tax=Halochromatium salexigens TaxID=49447 RepID=A0AAJ0UIQ8_HALSE|nr:DNA-binding protein [Halochromatium salexigens]MBK5932276.1 hypothetical protein [Halochromatium salexigens]
MPRPGSISAEDVRAAIYECLSQCEAPSVDRLRTHLGRGSNTTILRLRESVIEEIRDQLQGHALPAGMPESLQAPMASLWQTAQEVAFARLAEERAEAQRQISEAQTAQAAAEQQARQAAQAHDQITAVAEERRVLNETLRGERDQARAEVREAQRAQETLRQTLQSAHGAERNGLRQQLEQSRVQAEDLRVELARERDYQAGQEQQCLRVIEEVRSERDALKQRLEAQARESEQRLQALSKALAEQQRKAMRMEAELEVARAEQVQATQESHRLSPVFMLSRHH